MRVRWWSVLFVVVGMLGAMLAVGSVPVQAEPSEGEPVAAAAPPQACVVGGSCYGTIQEAVNAAPAGATVTVSAGTFNESVTISKPLTILGPKSTVSPVTGNWGDVSTQAVVAGTRANNQGPQATLVLLGGAGGAVISGLTLAEGSGLRAVVESQGNADDVEIRRNRIVVSTVGIASRAPGYAPPGYNAHDDWLIEDNLVEAKPGITTATGMNVWDHRDVTVSANLFVGLERGLQMDGTNGPVDARWTVVGNGFEEIARRGVQIASVTNGAMVRVENNEFANNNVGTTVANEGANDPYSGALRVRGQKLSTATFVVTGNTFTGNGRSAVVWGHDSDITVSASNATLTGNTFDVPVGAHAVSYASLSDRTLNLTGNRWSVCTSDRLSALTRLLPTPKTGGSLPPNVVFDTAGATLASCTLTNTTPTSQRSGFVTLSAQTNGGAGAIVSFFVDGAARGSGTTDASGVATVSATLSPGAYQVTANSPAASGATPVTLNVFGRSVCSAGCDHQTIQAAVTAASPFETVTVGAGTYAESVTLNKPLTLVGPKAAVSPVTGDWGALSTQAVLTGVGSQPALTFAAGSSGSIVRGLTVDLGSTADRAVSAAGALSDITFQRNRVVSSKAGIYATPYPSQRWLIDDNVLQAKTGSTNTGTGIFLWYVTEVTISGNVVSGFERGMQMDGTAHITSPATWTISGNRFDGNLRRGLQVHRAPDGAIVRVLDNTFTNNNATQGSDPYSGALRFNGVGVPTSATFLVTGNTFTGNTGSAVVWGDDKDITVSASKATFTGNTFNAPLGAYAVSYASLSDQTLNLTGNTWRVCGASGVDSLVRLLPAPKVAGGLPVNVQVNTANATVTGCSLSHTTVTSQRSGRVTLSAQTDAGAGATVAFFVNGLPRGSATTNTAGVATLSAILAPGQYQVSVTSPTAAAPTPVTLNVFGRSVCASGCDHTSIQAAVTAAAPFETVTVGAGTYILSSTVTLNGVSLEGAGSGPGGTIIRPGTAGVTALSLTGGTMSAPVTLADVSVSGFSTNIAAGGAAQISGVASSHASNHALVLNATESMVIEDSSFTASSIGLRVGSGVTVRGLRIRRTHFDDNLKQGWYIAQEGPTGAAPFDDVVVEDSTFNRNFEKGVYLERASNFVLRRVTVDGSGVNPAYVFNNGIDFNLKWRAYSNIVLDGVTIRNSGVTTAAMARNPSQPWFSSALVIKARDDASSYDKTPATLSGVTIRNSTIEGLENGVVFGEPGKLITGVSGLVLENNTITASQCALVNTSKAPVPAGGNWWGTVDEETVTSGVCNAEGSGVVTVQPFLDGPNGSPVVASGTILVTVRDAAGNGVAGVTVGATSRAAQLTGSDGRATFTGLNPGTFTVTVSAGAAYTLVGQASRLVNLAVGLAANVEFSVVGVGSLSGTVSDTSGNGVAGVVVSAAHKSATTDAAGRYAITGLTVGAYTVTLPATLPSGYTAAGPTVRQVNLAAGQAATADFVLAQVSSITGRVADRNGAGVAGVTVTLSPPQGSTETRLTDADGWYRFTGRNAFGLHGVSIQPPTEYVSGGRTSTTVNLAAGQLATADFVIVPTGVIAGRVLDSAGRPVAGVAVALDRACTGSTVSTSSDLAGRYVFTGCMVSGPFTVTVTPPSGFVAAGPSSRTVTRPEGGSVGADFALAETSSISGRVVDTTGVGVAGIAVSLRSPGGGTFMAATSDLEGRFRFSSLGQSGVYTVTMSGTGLPTGFTLGGSPERLVNLALGQTAQVEFTLAQTSSIGGVVLDTAGAAVAGVAVTLDPVNAGDDVVLVSGIDGRYVRAGLAAGAYDVTVAVPEGFVVAGGTTTRVNLASGATALASFTLARTSSIGGRVLDASAAPLSGVSVRVAPANGAPVDLVTGVDGRYLATGLSSIGAHDVTVTVPNGFTAAGATSARVNLATGASATADFTLGRASSVAGRVVDAAGNGVAGLTVTLDPLAAGDDVLRITDVDGRFVASGLATGTYDVSVAVPEGFVAASAVKVRVNLGEGVATVDYRVTRTASITGRVVDDARLGLAGVAVTLTSASLVRSVLTDPTGRFEFSGLPSALYTVTIAATSDAGLPAGFAPSGPTTRGVFLADGRAATTEFLLSRTSAVSGRVVDTAGNALAGVTATLSPVAGGASRTATTDLDGRYVVSGLTAGAYDVSAEVPAGFTSGGSTANRVNLVAGSSATADFTLARTSSIGGGVVNTAGTPVAGITVTLTGSGTGTTATKADGTYSFTSLTATGSYSVTIAVPSGFAAVGSASRVVNLAAGQSALASFTVVEQGSITGRVVDNTGAGIAGVTVTLSATLSTQTDLEGRYRFSNLTSGTTQIVSVTLPSAYVQPTGQNLLVQSVAVGSRAQDVVLLPPGTVSGYAFIDLNGNDERDEGEPALGGVVATLAPSGAQVTTSANGFYRFDNAPAGSTVDFTAPSGFAQVAGTVVATSKVARLRPFNGASAAFLRDVGLLGTGTLVGYVTIDGQPLAGVALTVGGSTVFTSPDGVALFTGLSGSVTMTLTVPSGFSLQSGTATRPITVGSGSPVQAFALEAVAGADSGSDTQIPGPGAATPSTEVRQRLDVRPVGVTPITVTTPDGPVKLRFSGVSVASGVTPEVVVRPLGYDATARGVQAAGPRFGLTAEQFAFDEVEVCVPVNSSAVRGSGRSSDRIRLVHTRTDGTEHDITTRVDLAGTTGEVCGVADTFSTFQAAIVVSDRVAGHDRYDTAARTALELHPSGAATVYVATGADFPDALAAGSAAAAADAPLLLVRPDDVPAVTRTALRRLRPAAVVLVGGTQAVTARVEAQLAAITGVAVTRVAGVDRYDTAARLALRQFTNGVSTVYVATGTNFPDAVAAGATAARHGAALLLVPSDDLPASVRDALVVLSPQRIVVAGGVQAVSAVVVQQLRSSSATVQRVAGVDRYDTAARLTAGTAPGGAVVVATGTDFPDALVASTLAMRRGGSLLLLAGGAASGITQRWATDLAPSSLVVVGGANAVTATAELRLARLLPPATPARL